MWVCQIENHILRLILILKFYFNANSSSNSSTLVYYSFAALQQGNLCLCAAEQNLNVAGTCDMPCEGEDTEICGGSGIDSSVYASPPVVRGLSIKDPGMEISMT